jgi:hypothetical protein
MGTGLINKLVSMVTAWIYLSPSMVGDVMAEVELNESDSQNGLTVRTGYISKWKISVHMRSLNGQNINPGSFIIKYNAKSAPRSVALPVSAVVNGGQ